MIERIGKVILTGFILVFCFSLINGYVQAQTVISESVQPAALPHTYTVTLTLSTGGESVPLSFTVASSEFQATIWGILGEFQGVLRMENEQTIFIQYDLGFRELVTATGPEEGQWKGSVLIQEDKDIEIIKTPGYTFNLRLTRLD